MEEREQLYDQLFESMADGYCVIEFFDGPHGPLSDYIHVLDLADGSVVRRFTHARNGHSATYFDEVWEDAEHVLVVTYQDGQWAVVRLGVDGSMEYAVGPRRGSMDDRSPFQLQTR